MVSDAKGVDQWIFQGRPQGVSGLNAVVSWSAREWGPTRPVSAKTALNRVAGAGFEPA